MERAHRFRKSNGNIQRTSIQIDGNKIVIKITQKYEYSSEQVKFSCSKNKS